MKSAAEHSKDTCADCISGTDSAPHPLTSKKGEKVAAGVFTQPYATQLVLLALEDAIERGVIKEADVTQEKLEHFLSTFGRRFYKLPIPSKDAVKIVLERKGEVIPPSISGIDGAIEVGISRKGAEIFSLSWQ